MHDIVVDEFEKYLSGDASQAFHDHLRACTACRTQVAELAEVTSFFIDLKPNAAGLAANGLPNISFPEPSPGFYNRLTYRIIERQQSEAWGLFSAGAVFFRRVAFVSLLLLACMGSFLVTRESSEGGADAASIIAQHDVSVVHSESADRDRLLVTLANYSQ